MARKITSAYLLVTFDCDALRPSRGPATRNDIVDDIVDDPSSTMVFNVAKIALAQASSTKSLTISLRVAGP